MMHLRLDGRPQAEFKDAPLLVRVGTHKEWLPTRLYRLLAKLVAARGKYVLTSDLADSDGDRVCHLVWRLRQRKSLKPLIESKRPLGYRINCEVQDIKGEVQQCR